jgi:hypothetical protein
LTETCVLLATGLLRHQGVETECLGICGALRRGRAECVPPRKPPLAPSPGLRRRAIRAGPAPRGGAGSARPQGRHRPGRDMSPVGHKPLASSSGANEMPRHSWGLSMRTHGVRPSEKTAPKRHPRALHREAILARMADSAEGRAPHARKGGLASTGGSSHDATGRSIAPFMIMLCLGFRTALRRGRGDRAPPRKPPSASSPAFPRKAMPDWIGPPWEGRAPHAR